MYVDTDTTATFPATFYSNATDHVLQQYAYGIEEFAYVTDWYASLVMDIGMIKTT